MKRKGSDGALWMNVFMTCTEQRGMLAQVLVYACTQPWCMMCVTAKSLRYGRVEVLIWLTVLIINMLEFIVIMTFTKAGGTLVHACPQI